MINAHLLRGQQACLLISNTRSCTPPPSNCAVPPTKLGHKHSRTPVGVLGHRAPGAGNLSGKKKQSHPRVLRCRMYTMWCVQTLRRVPGCCSKLLHPSRVISYNLQATHSTTSYSMTEVTSRTMGPWCAVESKLLTRFTERNTTLSVYNVA